MRCALAVLAGLALSLPAYAQDEAPPVRWPTLAQAAPDAAGFAPRGWAVEASRTGDLDGDGIADLVAILHQRDPASLLHQEGRSDLDTNPRLLLVALGRRGGQRGGSYRLLVANHMLIPRWTEWNLDDPLGDLAGFAVKRGGFTVPLHLFANAGGWTAFDRTFTFRLTGGRCVLIGFDEQRIQRNTGETTTTSVDYLTGARTVTTAQADDDGPGRTRRDRVARRGLTIEQVGDGMEFEVK